MKVKIIKLLDFEGRVDRYAVEIIEEVTGGVRCCQDFADYDTAARAANFVRAAAEVFAGELPDDAQKFFRLIRNAAETPVLEAELEAELKRENVHRRLS